MDKGIGVTLSGVGTEIFALAGTTMFTAALDIPGVFAPLIPHIASIIAESLGDAVLAVGQLGAVERAAAHLGGEVGAGYAKDLLGHNMVNTLLQVRNLLFQTNEQAFGNLAQKHTALAARVKEACLWAAEQFRRQQVKHPVGEFRRREHLVAAQVSQAVKNIGAIVVLHIYKVGYNATVDRCVQARRSSAPVPAHRRGCTDGFV